MKFSSPLPLSARCWHWLFALLLCLTPAGTRGALINSRGLWDFDGTLNSYWSCFPPVSADALALGIDYTFASSGGYSYLQAQPFTTSAKRLTVLNNSGANGWPGAAARTNQWTVVMDIRFDALAPYAGILQLDPGNVGDVSFYVNGANGTLTGGLGTLSAANAIAANTWYRIALTCGNNGAGGALTLKAYINGALTGTRTSAFDGAYAMRPTFLMLSDNNSELKPTKLNSLGLWGEELSAADIASLAGPQTYGLTWPGFSDANCPVLAAGPRAVLVGQNLNITFSTPSPTPRDRLALFLDGDVLSAGTMKRAIYIGGGASPTTAPPGGMPVMSTAGLAGGRYWLHYLPGDTFVSAHRIAIRLDATAPVISISPSSTYPGGTVSVSGAVEPGSPGARILLQEGSKELPVYAGSVNPWGQFTVDAVPIPRNAPVANTQIHVIPTGTTEPHKQSAPFLVSLPPLVTISGKVEQRVEVAAVPGSYVIAQATGVTVSAFTTDGELAGSAVSQSPGGVYSIPGLFPGMYTVTANFPKTTSVDVTTASGQTAATANFLGDAPSNESCTPSVELINLSAVTNSSGFFAGQSPTAVGNQVSTPFASFATIAGSSAQNITFTATMRYDCFSDVSVLQTGARIQVSGPGISPGTTVRPDPPFQMSDRIIKFSFTVNVNQLTGGAYSLTFIAGTYLPPENQVPAGLSPYSNASWSFPLQVTDLTSRWGSGYATGVAINAAPDAATNSINYRFSGTVPASAVAWSENIDLGLVQLANSISFGYPVNETFSTAGSYTAAATAQAQIKLLGLDILDESIAFQSYPTPPSGLLGLTYRTPVRTIELYNECWGIPGLSIDKRQCIKLCFVGCKKCVGISAGAFACIGGRVDVQGRIAANLRGGLTLTPHVTLATPIRVQLDAAVCSGGAEIRPQLDFSIPVNLDFDPLAGGFGDGCIKLNAVLNYYVRCFGFTLFNGSKNLAEKTWGNCPAGAAARNAPNVYGTIESPIITPAIAANASCEAMAVWTGDAGMAGSEGAGLLYYRKGNTSGTWGPVSLIPTGGSLAENPAVAWLDANRALCVWTHPKSTPAPPPEGQDPALSTGLELHWSIYQNGVWSAPLFITNDSVWDIRPVLASNGAGQATCVWQRLNQPNPNVEPTVPMILVASTFAGSTWTAPVNVAPGSAGVDYQATVRYDAQGNPGVAWLRDPDAFADTETQTVNHMNQSLWYSHKSGATAWSTPQQITGISTGAYSPSLDFDNAHQPCVAFLVPGVNKLESPTALTGGGGNQSRLWFARRSSGTWGAAELRRSTGIFNYPVAGERPTLRIDTGNRAIVVFRRFGQGGTGPGSDAPVHTTGDVGIATAALPASGTAITWRADYYTDDGQLNWQIAYDRARNGYCGKMFWVKGDTDGASTYFVNETIEDTKPDPAILRGDFTVSNPHPLSNASVTWTVRVTNRGLINAGGAADPLRVEIRRDSPTGVLIGSGSSNAVLALGEIASIPVAAAFPAGGQQRFFAVVLPPATRTEVTDANNTAELVVGGVAPPCNLVVSPAPQNGGTLLDWDPPAGTDNYRYRILRRAAGGPWEIIGYNLWDNFCDPSALPGVSYEYAVVAEDPASGVISDACTPGFVVIPSLIPNDPGPLPKLNIARDYSASPVILSWLDSDPLLYIERSADMTFGSWSRMHNTTGKTGSNRTLTVPPQRPAEFFRLRRD